VSALQNVEWEPCLLEPTRDERLEREVRQALGVVPDWTPYFFRCPWVVRVFIDFETLSFTHTDLEFSEMVALVVSQDNSCRYCYAAHRALLRMLGISERSIRKLEQDLIAAEVTPRVKLGLDFVRRVSRANPIPSAADRASLRAAGYAPAAIDELAFLASIHVFANRLTTLPAIPPQTVERLPDRWPIRLLRPLLGWQLRRRQGRLRIDATPTGLTSGPFQELVAALDGLPAARFQRRVIDEAWASPFLSRRAKALVFAVVARGLGCPLSECEGVRLLGAEGIEQGEVEEILAHLASPRLDPVESVIVPFARETIWYRPAEIQRHARRVRERLTAEQFIDLVATAALANAVCRLSAALALPDRNRA
jgi:AhpD family alkylhydroperoxidase